MAKKVITKPMQVCDRAQEYGLLYSDTKSFLMDLDIACKTYPIDLDKLLAADKYDFIHDIIGIQNHVNRRSRTFDGRFSPWCAT